ncbi:MAG: hypothetical protein ABIQ56_00020, partial [Chitinophagaceae bacterium]
AKCAFDLARTRKFLQGLKQALHLLLQQESSRPIQVLYAGSGPYALLALLVCSFFKKGEVEFTVLDLHSASVESVKRLVNGFGLEHFFPEIIVADATQYKWEKALPLHMFIVETLQTALQNEQQVTIAAQIAPQLAPGGIMIPERIEVTAVLVNTELRHALQLSLEPDESGGKPIVDIGLVINLNKDSAIHAANTITEPFAPVNFSLPSEFLRPPYTLELHTTITVFGQEQIKDFDSGLTMPIVISPADQLIGKKEIAFNYINTIVPRVEWKIT